MSLPSEYKRLKYIESTGTQYIDTGIKNKSSLSITCDVIMNETAGNYLFGGKENIPKGIACWNSTAGFRAYFNDSTSPAIPVFQPGSSVSVSMTNGETTVNGTIHTYTPVADFELSSNLMLFAGEDHAYPSKIYMKSFTIKDGTTLVRKFIPVQRRSDNVVGMYDDCNTGKNLFNTSSVTWETGKLLEPSTGAISSNTNYKVSGFIPVTFSAGAYTVSFLKTEMVGTGTANTICFYDSNNNYVSGFGYTAGYQTYAYNTYSITVPDNAAYYKYCQRNTDVQVQLEEGNTATAYEPYDGFYTNLGTGSFVAGPVYGTVYPLVQKKVKIPNRLPKEYTELEYLQSSGTQWIDTGIIGTVDTSFELIYSQTSIGNVFGYRDAAASNNISYWTGNPDIFYVDFNNSDYDKYRLQLNDVSSYFNKKLKIECGKSLRKITNLDTSTVLGQNVVLNSDNITTGNLYLLNTNGVPYIPDLPSAKIYSCKISNGLTLQRDLVPAKRNSDSVLGMYDLANSEKNLFDPSTFIAVSLEELIYHPIAVPNGTYTMSSTDFPLVSSITNVFFLPGNVSSGASSSANGVAVDKPITITVTDGYYTICERYATSQNTNHPKDFHWQIESGSTATAYEPYPFYTNAGTGTFTAGPSVVNTITTNKKYFVHTNIPFAYTPLTYIENTGTAYIDLGFIPNQTTSCAVHFQYNGPSTNVYDVLFGSRIAHKIRQFAAWSRSDSSGESVRIDYANGENIYGWSMNSGNNIVLVKGNDYHYEMGHTYFKLPEFNINHTFPDTIDYQGDFTCPGNLYLFAMHQCASDTDPGSATWNAYAKVYSVKINHNGSVIRDMIPAKRKSDNALGMYDKITDSFFASQGTGMVAGTELANYTLYPITQSRYFYGG